MKSAAEQLELLRRGTVTIHTEEALRAKLERGVSEKTPLRVKLGMDPTAPDIHLGHTVVLRKLRQFQDLGHRAVLIIGDYTARVGDPSGQSKTRPALTGDEIEANLATYLDQVGLVLDTEKLEMRRNSEWFEPLRFADVLRLASATTVARMLERDDFAKRMDKNAPVSLHELLYPVMQGHYSVEVRADVELGGTDQTFNLLVGRDFQRAAGQEPQVAITMPLLVGLDGTEKMSKSLDNYVGVTDAANEMFGKCMSIPDALMANYLELLTDLPLEEVSRLANAIHPREAKERLALMVTASYHGEDAAVTAAEGFRRVFSEKKLPDEMPELALAAAPVGLLKLLVEAGHAKSTSEARRLVTGGGVSIDGEKMTDPKAEVAPADGAVLRTGRRRFARLRVKE